MPATRRKLAQEIPDIVSDCDKSTGERSEWQAHSTPPNTRPIARWFAALSKRRSSPTPMNGTRRAGFRACSTKRPPRSGGWAWAFPKHMAAPASLISCCAGPGGVSLLVIEGDAPGLSRTPLKKMGWWASDTATLYFDNCRVPAQNLLGEEGRGFKIIMHNFNSERLTMAAGCIAAARVCLDDAMEYARQRHTFGKPLAQHQVIRHKLVDMAQRVAASQAMLEMLAWRLDHGESPVAEICMLKNQATQTMAFCASEAVQIFGGAGYMRGIKVERIYREVKVNAIGGGSEEIMKDLASRQMGL